MRVVVVGAGATGLLIARQLVAAGIPTVVHEASGHIGGQVRTLLFEQRPVDVGAEAIHIGIPSVGTLIDDLDMADSIVAARPGGSWLVTPKGLKPLPAGVGPTGPTRVRPVLESRILSVGALLRAAQEPLRARPVTDTSTLTVGGFLRQRFGNEVTDRFVDPLLGNLHSGDIDRLALEATAPQLLQTARSGRSMMPWRRPARPTPIRGSGGAGRSMFSSFPTGLHELTDALAEAPELHTNSPVTALTPSGGGWQVTTPAGVEHADAVALACPAHVAADLLAPFVPGASEPMRLTPMADVATVVLAYDRNQPCEVLEQANGLLLPSTSGRLVKAMTNMSRKWSHVEHPDLHIIRASVGRAGQSDLDDLDDDALVERVVTDLHEVADLPERCEVSMVVRWPRAMPQLEVGHLARVQAYRAALEGLPPLVLAGASHDGLGIGSVLKHADARASELISHLTRSEQA